MTPQDPDGFITAVEGMLQRQEETKEYIYIYDQ